MKSVGNASNNALICLNNKKTGVNHFHTTVHHTYQGTPNLLQYAVLFTVRRTYRSTRVRGTPYTLHPTPYTLHHGLQTNVCMDYEPEPSCSVQCAKAFSRRSTQPRATRLEDGLIWCHQCNTYQSGVINVTPINLVSSM